MSVCVVCVCSYKLQKIISFTDIDNDVQRTTSQYRFETSGGSYIFMCVYEKKRKTIRLIFIHLYKINNTKNVYEYTVHTHSHRED